MAYRTIADRDHAQYEADFEAFRKTRMNPLLEELALFAGTKPAEFLEALWNAFHYGLDPYHCKGNFLYFRGRFPSEILFWIEVNTRGVSKDSFRNYLRQDRAIEIWNSRDWKLPESVEEDLKILFEQNYRHILAAARK